MRVRVLALIPVALLGCESARPAQSTPGLAPPIANKQTPPVRPQRRWSTLTGTTISIVPDGPRFEIPKDWIVGDTDTEQLHLSLKQLDAVKVGAGEWDTEYAEVVNATLEFDTCAFAGGGEGWGKDAVSFGDLQMRVYVVHDDLAAIQRRIDEQGAKAVTVIESPAREDARNGRPFKARAPTKLDPPTHATTPPWSETRFSYELFYGDYGSTAHVEYWLRSFGADTVVVVFMFAGRGDKESVGIRDSLSWPGHS